MHICHVTSMHNSESDRIFQRACRGLAHMGHKVTLIVTHDKRETIDGVDILPITPRPLATLKRRILSSIEAFRYSKNTPADVYIFHDPDLVPFMLLLSLMGRKVVYDIHENHIARINSLRLPSFVRRLLVVTFRLYELLAFQIFAGLMVTTYSMERLYSFTGRPVQTIQNTVYLPSLPGINLNPPKEEAITIYTSGGNGRKRHCENTIRAFPAIREAIPGVKMVFAGSYSPAGYQEELEALVKELGLEGEVEILGKMPWAENFERTARQHVGCVFYEDNENNRVTLPNRLFEYMACGVAVLGEDFPEVRRVVTGAGSGLLLDSSTPEGIAEAAIEMLKDPERMRAMQEAGREAIRGKMGYQEELKRMVAFLERIV